MTLPTPIDDKHNKPDFGDLETEITWIPHRVSERRILWTARQHISSASLKPVHAHLICVMTENIVPTTLAASAAGSRGIPYYEKLKRDLRETLQKKRLLDKNMVVYQIFLFRDNPEVHNTKAALEDQIYRFEASYLEETGAGNIIKGFDNYIKGSTATGAAANSTAGTSTRRKGGILEHDRVFSRSSASFTRVGTMN